MSTSAALARPVRMLHGTPVEDLSREISGARSGVRALLKAIDDAAPNGRDYYLQPAGALSGATAERGLLSAALLTVDAELVALAYSDAPVEESRLAAAMTKVPESPTVFPWIHSNGTSGDELRATAKAVFLAAQAAEEKLRACVPNMRDYEDDEMWERARAQHVERVRAIRRVGGYFLQLALALKTVR